MSNGDGGGVDINVVIDLFPLVPRTPRRPRGPRRDRNTDQPGGGSSFRAPTPPPIPGVTPPVNNPFGIPGFGVPSTVPQPSDVVFRRGVTFGVGRLFGVGGLIISAAELLIDELEKRQSERIEREAEEAFETQMENRRRARARARADTPVRADRLPPINPEPEVPFVVFPRIPLPVPSTRPQTAEPLPEAQPQITFPAPEIPVPSRTVATPAPVAPSIPEVAPVQAPVVTPGTFEPATIPGFETPQTSVESLFTSQILADVLTRSEAVSVPSTQTPIGSAIPRVDVAELVDQQPARTRFAPATAPAPAAVGICPPCPRTKRECDDDLEEPRLECFKGLYRENLLDTEFTPWNEIDCITGAEL